MFSLPAPVRRMMEDLPGPVRAGLWIALSGSSFTGMLAIARHLSADLPIFVIVLFRVLFGLGFLSPFIIRNGIGALRTSRPGLYLVRGIAAFTGLSCYFFAASMIPLADVTAISFTRPIFGTIAAVVFLGEIAHGRRWSAVFVGFAGAMIIIRPGFQAINPGVLFMLGSVMAQTVNTVVIKRLSQTEAPDAIAIYQGIVFAPMALVAALFVWQMPTARDLVWLAGIGFLGAITQRAMPRAFAAADATVVISLDFLRLPIAALIGFVFFSEVPVIWVWLGATVIIAATVYIMRRESLAEGGGA
jgi:drug/metabolite transporter (DMT)-like permease